MIRSSAAFPARCRPRNPGRLIADVNQIVPLDDITANSNCLYFEVPYGGHLGFAEGRIRIREENFADRTFATFVEHLHFGKFRNTGVSTEV